MGENKVVLGSVAKQKYLILRRHNDKKARMLVSGILRVSQHLKKNEHFGVSVKKRMIPKPYRHIGVSNLFRVPLPAYWRLLYTLEEECVLVLDILDHKSYDTLFGYRKR